MTAQNTFDVVSKIDLQEISNAINQSMKEVITRFDFKGSKSRIWLEGKEKLILVSDDEFKLRSLNDILQQKLVKRGVPLKGLKYGNALSALKHSNPGDFNWSTLEEVEAQIKGAGLRISR